MHVWGLDLTYFRASPFRKNPQPEARHAVQWGASLLPTDFVGADFPEHDPAHRGHLDLFCMSKNRSLFL